MNRIQLGAVANLPLFRKRFPAEDRTGTWRYAGACQGPRSPLSRPSGDELLRPAVYLLRADPGRSSCAVPCYRGLWRSRGSTRVFWECSHIACVLLTDAGARERRQVEEGEQDEYLCFRFFSSRSSAAGAGRLSEQSDLAVPRISVRSEQTHLVFCSGKTRTTEAEEQDRMRARQIRRGG